MTGGLPYIQLLLYSGSAMYKLLKNSRKRLYADPERDNHSEKTELPYWQGTVVGIDINLNSSEVFTTLLKLIQDTYSEAAKKRRQERYRRAQFI